MLASLIRWSIQNRFLVLIGTLLLAAWGVHATLSYTARRLTGSLRYASHHPH